MKKITLVLLLTFGVLSLASCQKKLDTLDLALDEVIIKVDETKSVFIDVSNNKANLEVENSHATIVDASITNHTLNLKGLLEGESTITVTIKGTKVSKTLKVIVEKEETVIEDEEEKPLVVEGLDVWTETSYVNVFKEDEKTRRSSEKVNILMVKNEYESAQVVLRASEDFTVKNVEFGEFKNQEGQLLSQVEMTFNHIEYEYFVQNSPGSTIEGNIKWGPGYYPDALSNNKKMDVKANEAHAIYLTIHAKKETTPGIYKGQVYIDTTLGKASVIATIEVVDVELKDSKDATYSTYLWQLFIHGGIFAVDYKDQHPNDIIVQKFGHERYSEPWWALMEEFATMMKAYRINHLYVFTVQLLLDGGTVLNEDNTYTFNWSRFDEFIEFFLERDVVKGLTSNAWISGDKVGFIDRDSNGLSHTSSTLYNDTKANHWYSQFMPAFYQHLQDKGWLEIWHQNLKDEPMSANDLAIYDYMMGKKNQYMPTMVVGDPHERFSSGRHLHEVNKVDYLVPLTNVYDDNRAFYDAAVKQGVKLITYTCWVPTGSNLNTLIDRAVWQGRNIAWFNYHVGAVGYLCWGLMNWYRPITDFALGDTAKIYVDAENNTYKSSIRLAAQRDGSEEYDLLAMLGEHNAELAHELATNMASDTKSNYETKPRQMAAYREQLIRELVKVKGGN